MHAIYVQHIVGILFVYGLHKCRTRNEYSEDDSRGSEDDCVELKQKQTDGRNNEEDDDDNDLNNAKV